MCCYYHHRSRFGLIALGLVIATLGAVHYFGADCHRARFERHIADVCVQAAEQVHR